MSTQGIQKTIQKFGGLITKNSPTILTGLSVAGLITTTILAVKATPKAVMILDAETLLRTDAGVEDPTLSKTEAVKLTWKCYVPAAIMGAATIGCIVGANSINLRRNAALATVYSISEAALKEYQSKVIETIGEKKHKEIRDSIGRERITANPVINEDVVVTGRGETLCYDAFTGRYFRSSIEDIRRALNEVNRRLMNENAMTLNEVYYELGLKENEVGNMLGWNVDDGLIEPSFSSELTPDGRPCLVMQFEDLPKYCDMRY